MHIVDQEIALTGPPLPIHYFPFSCNRPSHGNEGVLNRVTRQKVTRGLIESPACERHLVFIRRKKVDCIGTMNVA